MEAERLALKAEGLTIFRWAQLLLVAQVHHCAEKRKHPLTLDRLAIYAFFSAHPFLLFDASSEVGGELIRGGVEPASLAYAAAPDRLANRRRRIQTDVTSLAARGLVDIVAQQGRLVVELGADGERIALSLHSLHAQALRQSANEVIATMDKLADRTLRHRANAVATDKALPVDAFGGP
jgi:hypothetical protein